MDFDISFWLIPAEKQEESIRKDIDLLAEKYHSFPFIPHITLYYLKPSPSLDEVIAFMDSSLKEVKKFEVVYDGMGYSDAFTKTLFAKYKINEPLLNLHSLFNNKFKSFGDYLLIPHMSFIYKNNMGAENQIREAQRIKLPPTLLIDSLFAVTRKGGSIKEEKDVLDWTTAHRIDFK